MRMKMSYNTYLEYAGIINERFLLWMGRWGNYSKKELNAQQ